jgi:pyridoxamine 5'-phosphate oxidase
MADDLLPDPLPESPLPLFHSWFEHAAAQRTQPNPDAMVLASVGEDGAPSARVVLCKRIDADAGYIVFYTNYQSRKGRELTQHPRAAAVFHWDQLHRQVRIEGPVLRSPEPESDRYFASRALTSRIGAWASHQSVPLASRGELVRRAAATALKYGLALGATEGAVPRPPHWGGFRLWIDKIELWSEGAFRIHDRALWTRALQPHEQSGFNAGPWRATRLNP